MSMQPAHKLRLGLLSATIWDNDGRYSVDLSRSYKDADGQWRNTASFGHNDLLNLAKLSERAEIWISRQINGGK